MKHVLFSIRDESTELWTVPFTGRTTSTGIRMFSESANEEGHTFQKYPASYRLYEVGLFDDETAEFIIHNEAQLLLSGLDAQRAASPPVPMPVLSAGA